MNIEPKRPALTKELNKELFLSYEYKKIELMTFCLREKLETSGTSRELTERIAHFLTTGQRLTAKEQRRINNQYSIKDTDPIGPDFHLDDSNREYFISKIGSSFSFIIPFRVWLKENADKTHKEAVTVYFQMIEKKRISSQQRNKDMRIKTGRLKKEKGF